MEDKRNPQTPLTPMQKNILNFAAEFLHQRGYPPTLGEIGKACGVANRSSVDYHLKALESRGFLKRSESRHRGLELARNPFQVPILGRVGAGGGMIAQDYVEGYYTYKTFVLGTDFLLRVKGDSMLDEGILEGDMVQVRRQPAAEDGDIVVALVGEEGVVKRLRRSGRTYFLESANPKYAPIAADFQVIGKVVGLVRRYGK